ncbi:gliding motility lipoprotein GldB [Echinicola strongylocentroti]|uniref:Gliding motility lipoprotein GldB n=2 Tax=Echinicola strongylocentroti TaxID=1795355 RepID=A0A2Z4IQZ9_9BACT|nr:gliding motility lipoprotein GldB [Echinicola strongylocentroti]
MKRNSGIFLLILSLFCSCKQEQQDCGISEEVSNIPLTLSIERLELPLFEAKSEVDIAYLLEEHPYFSEVYLRDDLYPSKEHLVNTLYGIPKDTLMQELYQEVSANYPSIDQLETDLLNAFKHIKYYYPDFEVPKVYTFVSGFTTDLYMDREMIVIGLDYFLPSDHRFQPPDLPEYMTSRYNRAHLVPMIVTAISSRYNATDLEDNSLLAEMMFYGKAYHFTQAILPCTPEEQIIGYTPEELAACYENEDFIWTKLIEQEAIYETNPFEVRKYTGEAPFTDVISPDAPGRVGRWVGWNIVDAYAEKKDIGLVKLMAQKDAQKIFMNSAYKP